MVISSLLYAILANECFHRNALFLDGTAKRYPFVRLPYMVQAPRAADSWVSYVPRCRAPRCLASGSLLQILRLLNGLAVSLCQEQLQVLSGNRD